MVVDEKYVTRYEPSHGTTLGGTRAATKDYDKEKT